MNTRNTQHPTSNNQHPTSRFPNSAHPNLRLVGCWMLDVGRWMFPFISSSLRPLGLLCALSLLLLILCPGCLTRPALVHQTFAFETPLATNALAPQNGHVLALRPIQVSPLFAGRSLAYRTGPESYELDPYASFLVPPATALAIPLRAYLRNSGAFQEVIEPGSPLVPDTIAQTEVTELYGDFRQPNQPAAVLSLRLLFLRAGAAKNPELLFQKAYSRRVPLHENTAAAVVAGWDQALAEIMAAATSDLRSPN
jgi:cholesterol transport system auxiliary component